MRTVALAGLLLGISISIGCGTVKTQSDGGDDDAVVSITVGPTDPTTPLGVDVSFTAEGTRGDSSTVDVTDDVTWTSSDEAVATIGDGGQAVSLAVGTTTITATDGAGVSGTTLLTVDPAAPVTLVVTPDGITGNTNQSQQFTATATFTDDTVVDVTASTDWESTEPGVATIDATGLALGVGAGTTSIAATYDGAFDDTTWTIVATACGDSAVGAGEELDPPTSPFTSIAVDAGTCRWDFSGIRQLYCNGTWSWAGPDGCDQADADIMCRLVTDNPASTAISWSDIIALDLPGFCGNQTETCTTIVTDRGVTETVRYTDASLLNDGHHGGGSVIADPVCTNP
jgi:hypothetical protein